MTLPCNHNRSNLFVASFQIEGLCSALRMTVASGAKPGPAALELLKSLRDALVRTDTGLIIEHLPNVNDDMDPHDVLATAEVVRTTILAFLTSEEVEEQRGVFGFHALQQLS